MKLKKNASVLDMDDPEPLIGFVMGGGTTPLTVARRYSGKPLYDRIASGLYEMDSHYGDQYSETSGIDEEHELQLQFIDSEHRKQLSDLRSQLERLKLENQSLKLLTEDETKYTGTRDSEEDDSSDGTIVHTPMETVDLSEDPNAPLLRKDSAIVRAKRTPRSGTGVKQMDTPTCVVCAYKLF